jgi:hypothetical protein
MVAPVLLALILDPLLLGTLAVTTLLSHFIVFAAERGIKRVTIR